ncbi:MAG: ImmA/IrrE family metallo-endopeptidase [Armatimonadetes bacterium]|nr:ImmA/IrrE family metallo-endopeptidase [Armatimonadota bacterium]
MRAEPPYLQGERAARALRHELGLGIAPVDIWEVVRRREVFVALHDFGETGGDGLYLWRGSDTAGVPLIVVNSAKRPSRQRFTAAHELGHHEMHRFEAADVLIADEEVGTDGDEREAAANAFAAYLLAPTEDLRDSVKAIGDPPTPAGLVRLMRRYGLSYQALAYRLRNTGLISQKALDALLTDGEGQVARLMRSQGFEEDSIFPAPRGVPEVLSREAMRLYRERVISDARLAELLRTTVEEALDAVRDAGMERPAEPDFDEEAVRELLG